MEEEGKYNSNYSLLTCIVNSKTHKCFDVQRVDKGLQHKQ